MSDQEEKGFASYRGGTNKGAPILCQECDLEGRKGEMMIYQGIEQMSNVPGVEANDTLDTTPYDVWKCKFGHRYQDGY